MVSGLVYGECRGEAHDGSEDALLVDTSAVGAAMLFDDLTRMPSAFPVVRLFVDGKP